MPITPEALEAAKKALIEFANKPSGGCSKYVLIDKVGNIINNSAGGKACHYELREGGYGSFAGKVENTHVSVHYVNGKDPDWLKFWCEDSAFSVFVPHWDENGAIFDTDAGGRQLTVTFAKLLRYSHEHKGKVKTWRKLVEMGVHPLTAAIATCCIDENFRFIGGHFLHGEVFVQPRTIDDLKCALTKQFDASKSVRYMDSPFQSANVFWPNPYRNDLPILTGNLFAKARVVEKQEKQSDGWGGYSYKKVAGKKQDVADELIKLTKEALGEKKDDIVPKVPKIKRLKRRAIPVKRKGAKRREA